MSPIVIRGRTLGVERNGIFNSSNTAPIPGGRLWPEAAQTWLAMRDAYAAHGGNPADCAPGGLESSARTFDQQVSLKNYWVGQGRPQNAATPGTSNHGWAIAVDCPSSRVQAWLLIHGPNYGWSHDEGALVGEPWHFRYVGASAATLRGLSRDPWVGFMPSEHRWITEYDRLTKVHANAPRRAVLRRVMTDQRKRIWKAAQPAASGGDGKGWTGGRIRRYRALLARTI
jgi:hypothetical protein